MDLVARDERHKSPECIQPVSEDAVQNLPGTESHEDRDETFPKPTVEDIAGLRFSNATLLLDLVKEDSQALLASCRTLRKEYQSTLAAHNRFLEENDALKLENARLEGVLSYQERELDHLRALPSSRHHVSQHLLDGIPLEDLRSNSGTSSPPA